MAKYFKREFSPRMALLEHENVSDFYVSCWQRNRSALPLLCFRLMMFILCAAILVYSMVITADTMGYGYWYIYMTHWGVVFITLSSGLATAVSAKAYFSGPIEASFGLPWLVKFHWLIFNITVTVSIFITIFYWSLLTDFGDNEESDFEINQALDVLTHAINSVVMFLLLVTSRQPMHLLHFYQPVLFSIVYLLFGLIYYYAGGTSSFGTTYIYPMMDWANPSVASITAVACLLLLIIVHLVVVAITLARDALARKLMGDSSSLNISNDGYD